MSIYDDLKGSLNAIIANAQLGLGMVATLETAAQPPASAFTLPWSVTPPVLPIGLVEAGLDKIWHIGGKNNAALVASTVDGGLHGLHGDLNASTSRVTSNGITATGIQQYGFYAAPCFDHHHKNLTLKQAANTNQACVRLVGDKIILENADIDTSLAINDTVRLYGYTDDVSKFSRFALVNCKLKGGIINLGVPDANLAAYGKNPVQVWILGGSFEYIQDRPGADPNYPAGICGRRHLTKLVMQDFTMTGGARFLDLDDPTVTSIKNCTYKNTLVTQAKVGDWIKGQTQNVVVT